MTEIILPLGPLPFGNREQECKEASNLYAQDNSINDRGRVYRVRRAFGFTRFLEKVSEDAQGQAITVLVNLENSEPDIVLSEFFNAYASYQKTFLKTANKKIRAHVQEALELGVAVYSDFEGPGARTVTKSVEKICGSVRSVSFDWFRKVVENLPGDIPILFLVDNAQDGEAALLEFMGQTFSEHFKQVKFIVGYRDSADRTADSFLNKLLDQRLQMRLADFPVPSVQLLSEICAQSECSVPTGFLEKLLKSSKNNMHKVIARLRDPSKGYDQRSPLSSLSPLARAILLYLYSARQSIAVEDLRLLTTNDPALYTDCIDFDQTLADLGEYIFISQEMSGRRLAQLAHCNSEEFSPTEVQAAKQQIYDFFEIRWNVASKTFKLSALLYDLSKSVAQAATAQFAQEMVRLCLADGEITLAKAYFEDAPRLDQRSSFDDYFVHVAFLITSKQYTTALVLLTDPPNPKWHGEKICSILEAVALNRCRHHKRSLSLIGELLDGDISPEEKALLVSFRISGLIHEGDKKQAQTAFLEHVEELVGAKNYAYFLRNGASAFASEAALDWARKAITVFEENDDFFGLCTAQSNLGAFHGLVGEHAQALQHCESAMKGLQTYGLHHLEEAITNKGLALACQKSWEKARIVLTEAIAISTNNVPKGYAWQILSLVHAAQGRSEEAMLSLENGLKILEKVQVVPHLQRYLTNAALVSSWVARDNPFTSSLLRDAAMNPYVHAPQSTQNALAHIEEGQINSMDDLLRHFMPPYTFYWAQEPLYILSKNLVAP